MKKSLWCLLPVLFLFGCAATEKTNGPIKVGFYPEAIGGDPSANPEPVYLQEPTRKIYRTKDPIISERDITGIWPFTTPDGSIGCVFVLDDSGRVRLDKLTMERQGSTLTAVVGDRMIINLQIDQHITDGILVIPHGMTTQEGLELKGAFKVVKPATPKPSAIPM